ncbi:MAG: response regulator [Spirochaetaceae bacterium]|jgi:signal transduction histidine kinase/CheY-like chemotaxis protein|nr:response regulator [Spirochaetaceae bacterium]
MPDMITGEGLFFRVFLESSAAFALADRNGLILLVNESCDRIIKSLALPPEKNLEQLLRNVPEYTELLRNPSEQDVFVLDLRDGNGQDRRLRVTFWRIAEDPAALGPERGPFLGISIRDHTREWNDEQRLKEDMHQVTQAAEAKSLFLANMSHEIRTPIQTIIGMTELLEDTRLNQEQAEYCRQVKFSADVLLSIINDILDYSKIEAGRMDIERIAFDLGQAMEQAVEMISLEAHKKGLEIIVDIPPELDRVIMGDPDKFRQVVINLAKNAVKFTRAGEITISLRRAVLEGAVNAMRVAVTDTGIGVPEESRERLFTTFFQADPSNTRRFGGTGLGLAISRNLVERMGGHIEMVPNVGGGSVFYFILPLEYADAPPRPMPDIPGGRDTRIFVVDDRADFRRVLLTSLHNLGFTNTGEAAFGDEALVELRGAAARGTPWEICFIDQVMLPMDGWRLASAIHADPAINSVRLVLMSPNGFLGAEAKMTLLRWFSAYIYKPVTRRRLAAVLADVLAGPLAEGGAESAGEEAARDGGTADAFVNRSIPAADTDRPLILIVEDNPVNQNLFALIIQKLGYPAILADDGIDALEKAAANPVEIIFMDIQMPRMNGYEAAAEFRRRGFAEPVIAVTASSHADERARCIEAGFNDVLIKPFKRPDVERMLAVWEKKSGCGRVPAESGTLTGAPPVRASFAMANGMAGGEITPFDAADLLDTFMGKAEIAKAMLARFINRTEGQIAEDLPRCLAVGDWEMGMREAHTIKGTAFQMTGKELGHAAAVLEAAFRVQDRDAAYVALPPMREAFARFRAETEPFLAGEL